MIPAVEAFENHTFDEIRIGEGALLTRTLKADDIELFAAMSGDVNPLHVDPDYANATGFHGIIAHNQWGAALISTVVGTRYPGPGTVCIGQALNFKLPLHVGDSLDVRVTVASKDETNHHVRLDCRCTNQHGAEVITGSVLVLPASDKVRRVPMPVMQVRLTDTTRRYRQLLALAAGLPPIRVAVVHPCSEEALRGAIEAAGLGLIIPILVGPEARIRAIAVSARIDLTGQRLVDTPHSHAAAARAVKMVRDGEADALMKGSLHTDELMAEVIKSVDGLRTERRVSQIFVLDVPAYAKPLLISDGAINIEPDLDAKRDIVLNAIDLAHALGIAQPRVAILAAVETVNAKMRSTIDAAALVVMACRGQITGALVDGPLAFDDAISPLAAKDKGIVSAVAGQADILIAPDLEAANMIVKQLQYLADSRAAGVVMGARVPVILTSRADDAPARIASCALALLIVKARNAAPQAG